MHIIFNRGVPIWFLHVPMSDIDSTKNIDNQYSLPFLLVKVIALQQHVKLYSMPIVVYSGLGFYYAIQTIIHPQNFYASPMKP